MALWIRFEHDGQVKFGTLSGEVITVHRGDMFSGSSATAEQVDVAVVKLLVPTQPSKMICLWNNFNMLATKLDLSTPTEPLYFIKASTSCLPGDASIRRPQSYDGKVIFEGELGVVIGKECRRVSEVDAREHIFGYTCVNDVTAVELLNKDSTFTQWTRAKSFDTFGVLGPVIATDLEPEGLVVKSHLNGTERQNYPVSDMIFPPYHLVSLISQDMSLMPGDVIACGTNVGVGSMKPGSTIEISIEGIGTLSNTYE
jgi:2-keto-4-pentenoate hydratase/2-oxohepta-3-ene-1,7-dioic acid hydratase in catechol pathway